MVQAQQDRAQRVHLTQDRILREIALLATSTIEHYLIDDHGEVCLQPGSPDGAMRAIASLKKKIIHTEHSVIYETEVRLWNKPTSLRMAAEHLGVLKGTSQALHVHLGEGMSALLVAFGGDDARPA